MNSTRFAIIGLLVLLLAGCAPGSVIETTTPSAVPQTPTQPPVPTATATSLPVAALVNGEGILLTEFQAELQRMQVAQTARGVEATLEEQQQIVLDDMIAQTLLAQAADAGGYKLTDGELEERINKLAEKMGGVQALSDWQVENKYTEESFAIELRRSIRAAWQRDQIIATVPEMLEQIHGQQILVYNADLAQQIYNQLLGGANFTALSWQYDPVTGGDLGWFPRGYLTRPEIEAAVFTLQPGEITPVIQTSFGYHIVQVVAREAQRKLTADARRMLQAQALEEWVTARKAESAIEIRVK